MKLKYKFKVVVGVAAMLVAVGFAILYLAPSRQTRHTQKASGAKPAGGCQTTQVELGQNNVDADQNKERNVQAAATVNAEVEYQKGLASEKGNGVSEDPSEAVRHFRAAAEQGHAKAQFRLASALTHGRGVRKDISESAKWCRKAAEQGHSEAQRCFGLMLLLGDGIAEDNAQALGWISKAIDQGNAKAHWMLGEIYEKGIRVPKNSGEANKWYRLAADIDRKSAENGDAEAQYFLAKMYNEGLGVASDSDQAEIWYRKAAEKGDDKAQYELGKLCSLKHYSSFNSNDRDEALKWWLKAAEQGNLDAQKSLGRHYKFFKSIAEAIKWYSEAATKGDIESQLKLAEMYSEGDGVPKDQSEAVKWYNMAADLGHAPAQFQLGIAYRQGKGVAKDCGEALKWYRKAAEQGHVQAQGLLGAMILDGEGAPKDTIEGLAWTNIAAASGDEDFIRWRDQAERDLTPEGVLLAQQRSKQIQERIKANTNPKTSTLKEDGEQAPSPRKGVTRASGSGAIISSSGHVLTAAHVVKGAKGVRVVTSKGELTASVLLVDEPNDIGVLKLPEGEYTAMPIRSSRSIRLGQSVSTVGFPNVEIQGFSPKVTRGEISSNFGIGDDPRTWQISVPVQPGNSGGPLIDDQGNLIGIIIAKLGVDAAKAIGDIPQNVNYAVKSSYARALLEPVLGEMKDRPDQSPKPMFEDMITRARESVVMIFVE